MVEVWRAVEGYEGLYEVSNLGRIKSLPRQKKAFGRVIIKPGRILTPSACKRTCYRNTPLVDAAGKKKQHTVHRLVARAFCEQTAPQRLHVNHIDSDKQNNRADNLEWVTHRENMRHAIEHDRIKALKGDQHPRSKLTQDQVQEIRRRYQKYSTGPNSGTALAKEFGVSNVAIHKVVCNYSWT